MSRDICLRISVLVYLCADILTDERTHGMEIGKFVRERVRQRRKTLGMTQEQLEAASGVPQGSISRIESGVAEDVHASTVIGFAKALQVSADYLLGLKAEDNGEQQEETITKTAGILHSGE